MLSRMSLRSSGLQLPGRLGGGFEEVTPDQPSTSPSAPGVQFPLLLQPTREAIRALYQSHRPACHHGAGGLQPIVGNFMSQDFFVGLLGIHDSAHSGSPLAPSPALSIPIPQAYCE